MSQHALLSGIQMTYKYTQLEVGGEGVGGLNGDEMALLNAAF